MAESSAEVAVVFLKRNCKNVDYRIKRKDNYKNQKRRKIKPGLYFRKGVSALLGKLHESLLPSLLKVNTPFFFKPTLIFLPISAVVAVPEFVEGVETTRKKTYINGVDVSILSERKQYLDADGRLITTSVKEYCKTGILTSYRSLDNFLQTWNDAEKKRAIIEELENQGIIFEELKEEIKTDLDIFDLICHIDWDAPALTRKERAENVRKRNYWTKYGDKARAVLDALLDKYAQTGIEEIEDMKVLTVDPIKGIGTPAEIVNLFGGKPQYLQAIRELEAEIYSAAQT